MAGRRFTLAMIAGILIGLALPGALGAVRIETSPSWETPDDVDFFDAALADVDRDGDLDLAAFAVDTVRLYRNGGTGFGSTPAWTSSDSTGGLFGKIVWADLDGDLYPDLVTSVGVYMNTNGVLAATATFPALRFSFAFAVGDANGDGFPDIVVGNIEQIDLYLNTAGSFDDTSDWNTTEDNVPEGIAFGDVDDDGFPELAVGSGPLYSRPARLYDNDAGVFESTAAWSSLEQDGVNGLLFGDPDEDGYPELVALTENFLETVPNHLYDNVGGVLSTTASWSSTRRSAGQDAVFADVDGDGDLDLIVANSPTADLSTFTLIPGTELAYLNEGGVIDPDHDWESVPDDYSGGLDVGDIDGDGHLDVVVANRGDLFEELPGKLRVYRNLGPNLPPAIDAMTVAPHELATGETGTITVSATDPDGDTLSYAFTATAGSIVSREGRVLRWRAPDQAGTYRVSVNVTDGKGGWDVDELSVHVVETPLFSPANPAFWLIIAALVAAFGIGGFFVVRGRRRATATPAADAPPPPSAATPRAAVPTPGAPTDPRAAGLKSAFGRGMLPRKMYGENLARVYGIPSSPQREALLRAFSDGRLDEALFEKNLLRLRPPAT